MSKLNQSITLTTTITEKIMLGGIGALTVVAPIIRSIWHVAK